MHSITKELDEKFRTTEPPRSDIVEDTRVRLQTEAARTLEALSQQAEACLRTLEEEHLAEAIGKLRGEVAGQVQERITEIQTALRKPCLDLKTWAGKADGAVNNMATVVEAAVNRLNAAEQKVESSFSGAVDGLERRAQDLLQSSASQIEKQAEEITARLGRSLQTSEAKFTEETNRQLATLKQAFLLLLEREAQAIVQEHRSQLRQAIDECGLAGIRQVEVKRGGAPPKKPQDTKTVAEGAGRNSTERQPGSTVSSSPKSPLDADLNKPSPFREQTAKPVDWTPAGEFAARPPANPWMRRASPKPRWVSALMIACLALLLVGIFLGLYYHSSTHERVEAYSPSRKEQPAAAVPASQTAAILPRPAESQDGAAAKPPEKPIEPPAPVSAPKPETMASLGNTASAGNAPKRATEEEEDESEVAPKRGDLTVNSDVPGAQISLDGRTDPSWVTPHTFHDLAARSYLVAVSKAGYESDLRSVRVGSESDASFKARLEAATGEITIATDPPGLEVLIDDKPYGKSPARAVLPVGNHTYKVVPPPGKAPLSKSFTIKSAGYILKQTVSW